jgi:sortase A
MQDLETAETSSHSLRRWTAPVLIIAGSAMLAWCVYFVADGALAQRRARAALEDAALASATTAEFEASRPIAGSPDESAATILSHGAAVGELAIPRLQLSAIVLHGSDAKTLRRGPGHLENTPLPGEAGNVVIAGHRDTFFRALREITAGDDIYVEMPSGRFHYRVASTRVVKPQDLSVLAPSEDAVLTLITCYPFWVLGDAPDRFVVRAVGVIDAAAFRPAPVRPLEIAPIPPPSRRARSATGPAGDEARIRQTIERFRAIYNARLASHEQGTAPLAFEPCTVQVGSDTATAVCTGMPSLGADRGDVRGRSFDLARGADGWAIRSVVAR